MKQIRLACALFLQGLVGQLAHAGTMPADVPALGYSPQSMERVSDPRQDFYRYAAGNWLRQIEIAGSDADAGGFTLLDHQLDRQLLTLIQQSASVTGAAKGSAQQQVGDFYNAAMDGARRDAESYRRYIAALLTAAGDAPEAAANHAARILALEARSLARGAGAFRWPTWHAWA